MKATHRQKDLPHQGERMKTQWSCLGGHAHWLADATEQGEPSVFVAGGDRLRV